MNKKNLNIINPDLSYGADMDFEIPFDEMDESKIDEINSVVDQIMIGVSHLWRHSKEKFIENCVTINNNKNKNNAIVKPDAYSKRDDEDSLSVFDLINELKVNDKKLLQIEADRFIMVMGAEVLKTATSSIPVALFKSELLNIIKRDDSNLNVIREIVKSNPLDFTFALSYHWDINLPDSDEDRQLLYSILAMSSGVYENRIPGHNQISKNLQLKRDSNDLLV